MTRPKRYLPHNPALAEYQRQQKEADEAARRDRKSTDLLRNAIVSPIEVNDPDGDRIVVMRSIRNDPLAALHSRRQIDEAQYQGGRAFQFDFETAERGPQAIDPSKEYVDGGQMPEPITEGMRKATKRLARIHGALGQNGSGLMHAFLIERRSPEKICQNRGLTGEREKVYVGKRIRECLDELAEIYGFACEAVSGKLTCQANQVHMGTIK
jgi:hypothetical protein